MAEHKEDSKSKKTFNVSSLSEREREDFEFVQSRISDLQVARQESHYGSYLENIWADADRDYTPHRLKTKGKRAIAVDEDKGWRGQVVTLGASDWQVDISQPNPFIKIQTALSILVDQNPVGVFLPASKKFQAVTELMKQLYQRSWEYAKSKQQLKLFVFNLAKYGWAIARTYPLRITRTVRNIVDYDQENPSKSKWEEKEVVEFNDIFRENIDPWNAWIDDMARPNNEYSLRDWCWRKVYSMDTAEEEFGRYSRWKFVQPGGLTTDRITVEGSRLGSTSKVFKERNLVEILFYENRIKDLFMVIANGVPIIIEPLPVSDSRGNKKLSCWQTYWNIRHAESPYGIGIYEAIRYDQALLDRIRNMTLDQLTLSIYKMFFYQGTQALTETGDIKIAPGIGKQVIDPRNITWLQVPGPGAEAWKGLEVLRNDLDNVSGITEPLLGVVTGKTAFEIAQAKESALKRLKHPLDNVTDALTQEAYITISLIQLLYSIPETYKVADSQLIADYLQEIEGDPELFERDEDGNFVAKVFPEFPLNLEKDEKGNLIETQETRFFRIKPRFLQWQGIINVKSQSVLSPSKQVDKALTLEMYNILVPLLGQPPELYANIAKDIVKLYDKDPRDILPALWLQEEPAEQAPAPPEEQPLIIPAAQAAQQASEETLTAPSAERVTSRIEVPEQPQGLVGRIVSRLARPFRV